MELTDNTRKAGLETFPRERHWSTSSSFENIYPSQKEFVQAVFSHHKETGTKLVGKDLRSRNGPKENIGISQIPEIIPCRDFGTLTFSANGNTADFIRVSKEYAKPYNLLEYICNYSSNRAQVDKLGLLLSVHGTVDYRHQTNVQVFTELAKLRDALTIILVVGSGWVVCDGLANHNLFSQLEVERKDLQIDPSRSYNFTSVAFVHFESIEEKEILHGEDYKIRLYPSNTNSTTRLPSLSSSPEEYFQLSGEDTHYIIIDSPSPSKQLEKTNFVKEIRYSFELHLTQNGDQKIPVINIFYGGSARDVIILLQKLEQNQNIILLYGLGGFCDDAVRFLRNPISDEFTFDHAEIWQKLASFQNSDRLLIVDLHLRNDLDKVFNVASKLLSPEKRIKLAVFDTQKESLGLVIDELVNDPEMNWHCVDAFKNALVDEQLRIIEGLVSSGFNISDVFEQSFLQDLYIRAMTRNPAILGFMNNYMPITERNNPKKFQLVYLEVLLSRLVKVADCKCSELDMNQHLFLFSVIQLDQSMSEFFWKRCDEPIAAAIFAKLLVLEMRSSSDFNQEEELLIKLSEILEAKACEFLDFFAKQEPQMAAENLRSQQLRWFNLTPLHLAEKAECNNFFSQKTVNNLQNELFYGRILPSTSWLRVLICTVLVIPCIFYLPWKANYKGVDYQMKGVVAQQVMCDRVSNRRQKQKSVEPTVKKQLRYSFGILFLSVYTSPISKYFVDTTFQILLVFAQSYMLTVVFDIQKNVSTLEWVLLGVSVSNLLKEVISCVWYEETRWRHRVRRYFMTNKWRIITTLGNLFAVTAFTLHAFTYDNTEASDWSQVFYIISVMANYSLILRSCLIWSYVGTYIIMIEEMVYNLANFLIVVGILSLCYGICLQSLLFSSRDRGTWSVIFGITLKPFLHIFGDKFLDSLAESGECDASSNNLFENCKLSFLRPVLALLLFLVYATLVNLMLVNLLIAIFTNTYALISGNLGQYWNLVVYRVAVMFYSMKNNYPGPIFLIMFLTELLISGFWKFRKYFTQSLVDLTDNKVAKTINLEREQNLFRAKRMEQMYFHDYFSQIEQT
ncbi:transient receptor potential cation channel subfamily M member 3-like isoform X2 [Convolutriloba macropyga]|uniref:transient receptor potential cation channel subfamily M member 3-like isoform X2 n=1 Tax=Convolutriloba macropyga TaxID=536237 RepID=UPI003F523FC6